MNAEAKENKHGFLSNLLPGWLRGRRLSKSKPKEEPAAAVEEKKAEQEKEDDHGAGHACESPCKWNYLKHGADWAPPLIACDVNCTRQSPIEIDPEALQRLLERSRNGELSAEEATATGNPMRLGEASMLLQNQLATAAPASKEQVIFNCGFKLELTAPGDGAFGLLKRGLAEEEVETYKVQQFHFHAPSEHTLGERFPLELHIVAKCLNHGKEDQKLVLAVFFDGKDEENDSAFLKTCEAALVAFTKAEKENKLQLSEQVREALDAAERDTKGDAGGRLDLMSLLSPEALLITYLGSLTTPPCSEDVTWYVVRKPLPASKEQLKRFGIYLQSGEGKDVTGNYRERQNVEVKANNQTLFVLAPDLPPLQKD